MRLITTATFIYKEPKPLDYCLPKFKWHSNLVVPTITIYEVFKVVLRETGENEALQSIAAMQKGSVVELTGSVAMNAAKLNLRYNLPMADSIILATANAYKCVIWTQDYDFEKLKRVKFFPKKDACNYS